MTRNATEVLGSILERRGWTEDDERSDYRKVARASIGRRIKRHESAALASIGSILEDVGDFTRQYFSSKATLPEELLKAIRLHHPNEYGPLKDKEIIARLSEMGSEREELIREVGPTLFKMRAVERLNDHGSLGGIALDDGQSAELAEVGPSGSGDLDIVVRNADGELAEGYNVAFSSYSESADAVLNHPSVIGTQEAAADYSSITDSGISEEAILAELSERGEALSSSVEFFNGLETLADFAPGLPLVILGIRKGVPYVMGRSSAEEALASFRKDLPEYAAYAGIGLIFSSLDAGLITLPAIYITRYFFKRREAEGFMRGALGSLKATVSSSPRFCPT